MVLRDDGSRHADVACRDEVVLRNGASDMAQVWDVALAWHVVLTRHW